MNERLKSIREFYKLNMRDFSERLGMSHGMISLLEAGSRTFTDRFIKSVCNEFKVNETWFRTGEGEMFAATTSEQEIASITASIIKENNPLRIQLEKIVYDLTPEQLSNVYQMAKKLVEAVDNEKDIPE